MTFLHDIDEEPKRLFASLYVRVSTLKTSQKDSPEHQLAVIKEKAIQEDLDIDESMIYKDMDTGTTITDRPEIQRLVKDAKKGMFQAVIFASLSRFSRDTLDALNLKRKLVDGLGIRLISLDEGYDSDIDKDELKFQIISAVNQKLSEQISTSSRRGIRESARKGNYVGSKAPYGYKKVTIDNIKTLKPDEETKKVVQLIFSKYVNEGMGEKSITNYLNSRGIPSPSNGTWGVSSIQRILQNEVYTGKKVFGKYSVKKITNVDDVTKRKKILRQNPKEQWETSIGTHEPIIKYSLYEAAQQKRLERGGGSRGGIRNKVNLFAGIIKCKHCQASMVSMKSGKVSKGGNTYRYLICSTRRRKGEQACSNGFWLSYEDFRNEMIDYLVKMIQNEISSNQLISKHGNLINIENNRDLIAEKKLTERQIETNRKILFSLRKEKMANEIQEEQYQFEKKQVELELTRFETKLKKLNEQVEFANNLDVLHEELEEALSELLNIDYEEFDKTHLLLKKLVNSIEVSDDGGIDVNLAFKLSERIISTVMD